LLLRPRSGVSIVVTPFVALVLTATAFTHLAWDELIFHVFDDFPVSVACPYLKQAIVMDVAELKI
jgi:hypothetical protein